MNQQSPDPRSGPFPLRARPDSSFFKHPLPFVLLPQPNNLLVVSLETSGFHVVAVESRSQVALTLPQVARQGSDAGLCVAAWRVGSGDVAASIDSKR